MYMDIKIQNCNSLQHILVHIIIKRLDFNHIYENQMRHETLLVSFKLLQKLCMANCERFFVVVVDQFEAIFLWLAKIKQKF